MTESFVELVGNKAAPFTEKQQRGARHNTCKFQFMAAAGATKSRCFPDIKLGKTLKKHAGIAFALCNGSSAWKAFLAMLPLMSRGNRLS